MSKLVTINQAMSLHSLGYKETTARYAYKFNNHYVLQNNIMRYTGVYLTLLLRVPTVDETIDWLRRKFHIIIYDATEPFVDPTKGYIVYSYKVKYCNVRRGWNGRIYIGQTKWSKDSYAAKRSAITIAIQYIKKIRKDVKRKRQSILRRKGIHNSK